MEEGNRAAADRAAAVGTTEPRGLRVAVAGTGFIGEVHAHAARRAGAHLVGVAASTPDRGEAAAARLGAERAFPDAEALVTASDVDVVHICTPNRLHASLAEAALAAGKHVICEKPLATTADEARRLVDAAAAADRIATVPFAYRFYPLVREARARVASGSIGPVRLIHGTYLQDWLATEDDDNWRGRPRRGRRLPRPSPTSARTGATSSSSSPATASSPCAPRPSPPCPSAPRTPAPTPSPVPTPAAPPTATAGPSPPRTSPSCCSGPSAASRARSSSARSRPAARTTSASRSPARPPRSPSTRSSPSACGWAAGRPPRSSSRDPAQLDPAAAPYAVLPPGHPQGYQTCFDAFVADTYRAVRAGDAAAVDGLPTFADGARAAAITDAVLRSAGGHTWEEIRS